MGTDNKFFIKSFYIFVMLIFLYPTFSFAEIQPDFYITAEDIQNAIPTEAPVVLTEKMQKELKIMEKRHFATTTKDEEDKYRITKLEKHLLGRTWEFSPVSERMNRLKLASQRKMLSGMSLPVGIRKYASPQRIANDSTPVYENEDNVGIIDGLMKLYAPEVYENWSRRKKRVNEAYSDG